MSNDDDDGNNTTNDDDKNQSSPSSPTATTSPSVRAQIEATTVGTPYFVNAQHVAPAPARVNQPVPVPSIYEDERGEIHNLRVGGMRLNILWSKAGVMRSGDLHATTQHDFVFRGRVCVWLLQSDGSTVKQVYEPYQYIAVPPYTPHVFEFLEDSVVAEWWDGPFFAWFYQPYRSLVQASFQPTRPGRFALYQIVDRSSSSWTEAVRTALRNPAVWTAAVLGVVVGSTLTRARTPPPPRLYYV